MSVIKRVHYCVRSFSDPICTETSIPLDLVVCADVPKFFFHRILVTQDKNQRSRMACTRTRGEVRGGGRKPWKQKGTGKARAGSSRSPLWRGGGVVFGPKPVVYEKKINFKERRLAIVTGLYASSHKITIVRDFVGSVRQFSTKLFLNLLRNFDASLLLKKVLIVVPEVTNNLSLSCRNLDNVILTSRENLKLRDILVSDSILIAEEVLSDFY